VSDLLATGGIGQALGPEQPGVVLDLAWRTPAGEARQSRVTKRIVTIPTVSYTTLFAVGTRRVGYVFFRNFVKPSVDALDQAFGELLAQGADELVLDLRYDGAGS